jgi:hypothetical protein
MKFRRYYQPSKPTQPTDINAVITFAVERGFFTQAAKTKQKNRQDKIRSSLYLRELQDAGNTPLQTLQN